MSKTPMILVSKKLFDELVGGEHTTGFVNYTAKNHIPVIYLTGVPEDELWICDNVKGIVAGITAPIPCLKTIIEQLL